MSSGKSVSKEARTAKVEISQRVDPPREPSLEYFFGTRGHRRSHLSAMQAAMQAADPPPKSKSLTIEERRARAHRRMRSAVARKFLRDIYGPRDYTYHRLDRYNMRLSPQTLEGFAGQLEQDFDPTVDLESYRPPEFPRKHTLEAPRPMNEREWRELSWLLKEATSPDEGFAEVKSSYINPGSTTASRHRESIDSFVARFSRQGVSFRFESEILQCLEDQYPSFRSLDDILLIVGCPTEAVAIRTADYLSMRWPETARLFLNDMNAYIRQELSLDAIEGDPVPGSVFERMSLRRGIPSQAFLRGTVLEITQSLEQLVFLIQAFRIPYLTALQRSWTSKAPIRYPDLAFLQPLKRVPDGGSCWHPLFKGSILVDGYPIPKRDHERGLEIPFHVMLSMARVLYPVCCDKGLFFKGFDTALVPTDVSRDSIQWHFIQSSDGKRLSQVDIIKAVPTWTHVDKDVDCSGKRSFLGFATKVDVSLGTEDADYESVRRCRISPSGHQLRLDGGQLGFSFASQNLPGPTMGLNFKLSRHQMAIQSMINGSYKEILYFMKDMAMILYDEKVKTAWLVSTLSTVLHTAHLWARCRPELVHSKGGNVQLPFAKAASDGGQAALDALLADDNSLIELHQSPGEKPFLLKDLIIRIWGNIELAIEESKKPPQTGARATMPREVGAWYLVDIALSPPLQRPKSLKLSWQKGGWYRIGEGTLLMLCSGLGSAMVPATGAHACKAWWPVPSGKDYCVASAAALRSSSLIHGVTVDLLMSGYILWQPKSSQADLDDCQHSAHDQIQTLQEIDYNREPRRARTCSEGEVPNAKIWALTEGGAFIFGSPIGFWGLRCRQWKRNPTKTGQTWLKLTRLLTH